jgi:dTDP-glucose 4,6-dehydratase/UDP-glucuronate decarboxylase
MASIGRKISGYDGDVVTGASGDPDYLTDNPNRRCPVIDKARTELGYEPQIKLEDGLERTLRWYFLEREKQA